MGQSPKSSNYTNNPKDYILVQGNTDIVDGWVKPRIWTKQITKSAKKGSTLLSVRAPVGDVSSTNYDIVIGRGIAALSENSFIFQLLKKIKSSGYWNKLTTGSTFESINSDDIKNLNFYIPFNIAEQKKVSDLLSLIDNSVALQQRQLDSYNKLKKGLLQKLFPKDGEKVPKVRFTNFTGDWEQHKLGMMAQIVRGASPRPIKSKKWFNDKSNIGWLRISDVTSQNGRITHLTQRLSEAGQSKTRIVNTPHLLLSIAASVGKPVINYIPTGVHDGFLIFLNPKFEIEYMFQWLTYYQNEWEKYGQPGSQINLNSDIIKNQSLFIATITEQKKIENILRHVDKLIAQQHKQLNELKSLKKYLLQKLFI